MTQLSALLDNTVDTLTAELEEGEFDALTPEKRADLRQVSLVLAGVADRVETMEAGWLAQRRLLLGQARVGVCAFAAGLAMATFVLVN